MSGCQWREASFGDVPLGALRVGTDVSGEPLFAGRVFHEGDVLPAKIVPSHQGAYVAWGGAEHKKDYYSVLCASDFEVGWVHCSDGMVPHNAVAAGQTSSGESLHIGRVLHDGTLTPGKVHGSHGCCYISYGGEELSFRDYEVLVTL